MWSAFKIALRAATWRSTANPRLVGWPSLFGWVVALAVVRCLLQVLEAGPVGGFNPYGLNSVVAWIAIALAVAAFFVRPPGRVTALAAMVVLSVLTEVILAVIPLGWPLISSVIPLDQIAESYPELSNFWKTTAAPIAMVALPALFWIGAMFAILRSFETDAPVRVLGKVIALWAALLIAKNALPHAPVFAGPDFDIRHANLWEHLRAQQAGQVDHARQGGVAPNGNELALGAARVDRTQPALLRAAFDGLPGQKPGATDVYAIGLAGWSEQDVFIKELDGAFASLSRVLPIKGKTVRLSNHPETFESLPIANRANFAAAVHAVAQVMDKDEDVLLLLMTSHGATNGVALQLLGGQTVLTTQEVATILNDEGIKNRVVIVSACFGGVFVKPLADDNTIVLTAADEKNTSFGCAPGRDWTYFGDALFNQSMRPGMDFKRAFDRARVMIAGWERMDGSTPSNPQGHFGPALVGKLAPLFEAMQRDSQ